MPRQRRSFSGKTAFSIAIGIVLMVLIDQALFKDWSPVPPETKQTPPAVESTIVIEQPEASHKPDFAPPREIEIAEPVLSPEDPVWIKNAVPSNAPEEAPKIVIIIDDMGMDRKHTREAMDLPAPLTLAFLPYAGDLERQTQYGRERGHELMVHVPMEPVDGGQDSGPAVLKPDIPPEEFGSILNDALGRFDGYVGINNHMGSKMTQDRPGMALVMTELKKRGLLFVDSRTISTSVAEDEARKAGIPHAGRDVFLDHEDTYEFVEGALEQLEKKALKDGIAIGIGHPKEETINALKAWIPTLKDKGIYLVPVSAVVSVPGE